MSDLDLSAAITAAVDHLAAPETPDYIGCTCCAADEPEWDWSNGDAVRIEAIVRQILAAAAPLIERQVREQVAREIERGENWTPFGPFSCYGCPVCDDTWEDEPTCTHHKAVEWAARIARGGTS